MMPLVWLGLRAVVLALILTPIIRDVFRAYGVVDKPDSGRKLHRYPIPRVGGIAVAISYFASIYIGGAAPGGFTPADLSLVSAIMPAVLVVFAVGLIDDFLGLKPWQKLLGQLIGAGLAYWAGVRVLAVGGYELGWWSIPTTILWLLICTNAFNLVDGLDGLAAGVGFFATVTIFASALLHQQIPLACATLPLAGCLLAFLYYNFNPATIFLGDCGSLLIGFLLGCYGVIWTQKSITLLGMTAPLMALAIPLMDVVIAVFRRFLRRQPIFGADRGHIHHRLIDRGLTPRRAVLLVYAFCGVAAGFSLLQALTRNAYLAVLIVALFSVVAWLGVRYLSYAEFALFGRFFRVGEFQRVLNTQLILEDFTAALWKSQTLEDCWQVLRKFYGRLGFSGAQLAAGGFRYSEGMEEMPATSYWTVRLPLENGGSIELAHEFEQAALPVTVTAIADVLRKRFDALPAERAAAQAAGS
jgi:UDP-GlcNAc:undecaprenyl-phosphate GlcNAc-1-phosphate transferase